MSRPRRLGRAEKRAQTRRHLLDAAREVFGRRGFHGASLEEIAEEAGYSKGALYYNYRTKEELFLALLEERLSERVDVIRHAFAGAASTADALREAARRYIDSLEANREWLLLFFEFWAYAVREGTIAAQFQESLRTLRHGVQAVIEEHAAALGVGPGEDTEELAIAANALALGIAVEKHADPGGVPDGLFGDMLTRLFRDQADDNTAG
jgi:AcrR family transcriptional regulator